MNPTEELYRSYLDLRWHFDPAAATAAGLSLYDDRLAAYDADSMRTHLSAFRSVASAAEQLDVDDTQEEIDRTAFLDEVRVLLFRFEHEKPHVRDPGFWLSHLFGAIYTLLKRHDLTPEARARAVRWRLAAVPAFLRSARETLREPPAVFLTTAEQMVEGGLRLMSEAAREGSAAVPDQAEALDAALGDAEAALQRFALALKSEIKPASDPLAFAVGEEQFNRRLHYEHALRAAAPELHRYGLHLVDEVEAEVAALARQIDPSRPWRAVVERLRAAAPAGGDLVEAFREEMVRARGFVEAHRLVSIPEGALEVIETPGFMRSLIPFAAYDPPGPFAEDRTGYFYVTSSMPGAEANHGDHCRYELAATALHEGYPGHHLQMLTAQGLGSDVRRVSWTPVTVEGWALYCEELMAERGFFESLEERLFQRLHLLWRAVRIVLDVGLHTRGMTPAQAVDYMVERLAMDRTRADAEVRRYCAMPTYQLSYAIGRREILQLRDAYRDRAGGDFDLREFHDALLGYGGLPVSLIRWGMGLGLEE